MRCLLPALVLLLVERLEPTVTGWFGRVNPFAFSPATLDWSPSARRFEAGTPPVWTNSTCSPLRNSPRRIRPIRPAIAFPVVHGVKKDSFDPSQHPHGFDHLGTGQGITRPHPVAQCCNCATRYAAFDFEQSGRFFSKFMHH
jgi:hypothetical protein